MDMWFFVVANFGHGAQNCEHSRMSFGGYMCSFLLGICLEVELLGPSAGRYLVLVGIAKWFYQFVLPPESSSGSTFLPRLGIGGLWMCSLQKGVCCTSLWFSLHFPDESSCQALVLMLIGQSSSFMNCLFKSFIHFISWIVHFLVFICWGSLYIVDTSFIGVINWKCLPLLCSLPFHSFIDIFWWMEVLYFGEEQCIHTSSLRSVLFVFF